VYSSTKGETPNGAGEMPVLVKINGIPFWQASGRTFPVVAGAEDPPPGDGKDGKSSDGDPTPPKGGDGGEGEEFDKDRAIATIRKLRENERATKAQLKELEDLRKRVKDIDDKDKSESERLQARNAELEREKADLERERQETRNVRAIERAATKAGAADPEDVYRLLDSSEFKHDEDGILMNAEELVTALLKKKPYLVGKSNGTTAVPGTPRSNGTPSHDDQVNKNR
jgi:hypothetical protein